LRYEVEITNVSRVPVNDMTLEDILPPSVTYRTGTTTFTNENSVTVPIPDATTGSPFPLDAGGITIPQPSLPPGATWKINYRVEILPFPNLPGGTVSIINQAIVNSIAVSDPQSLTSTVPIVGRIGNFVWNDTNGNGIRDSGEPGVNGVTVNLRNPDGSPARNVNGTVLTAVTANDGSGNPGFHTFFGVLAGNYIAEFVPPSQFVITTQNADGAGVNGSVNSDPNPLTRRTPQFALAGGEANLNVDAGLGSPATVGSFVWNDTDADGIQDVGELGIQGVQVDLLNADGSPALNFSNNPITTTTSAAGVYSFTGLIPGSYRVRYTLPSRYVFTTQNADSLGLNGAVNSDANIATGITNVFSLIVGQTNNNVDTGMRLVPLAKFVDKSIVNPGDPLNYTIRLLSPYAGPLSNARITDVVPSGTTFVSAGQGGTNAPPVTWNLGTTTAAVNGNNSLFSGNLIEFIGDNSSSGNVTTLNLTRPGSTLEGDLMVVSLVVRRNSGTTITAPVGCTEVQRHFTGTINNNSIILDSVVTKLA